MGIDFLSIGELLADMISVEYGESLVGTKSFKIFQGGSPSNVAANLKYLGKNAQLVACVGKDGIGNFLLEEVKKIGLSAEYIQQSADKPTTIVLIARSRSTPDFIAYRGADAYLQPLDDQIIQSARILHTTSFALSLQPSRNTIMSALTKAADMDKWISVDWNFAPAIWETDDGMAVFGKLMKLRPYLKVSMDDMERFFGVKASADYYKKRLDKYPCGFVCLTCGKDGVWFKEGDNLWQFQKAFPVDNVIDTTGAGDAFWAGFMEAVLDQRNSEECINNGLKIASYKVQIQGPLYQANDTPTDNLTGLG